MTFSENTRHAVLTLARVKFYTLNMEFIIGVLGFLLIVGIILARRERQQIERAQRTHRDAGKTPRARD